MKIPNQKASFQSLNISRLANRLCLFFLYLTYLILRRWWSSSSFTSLLLCSPQRRERRRENGKHQADPEVPVLHEPALAGGVVQRRDVARGGGAAGEQVIMMLSDCWRIGTRLPGLSSFLFLFSLPPPPQSHHGGLWKRQDRLQQQLQPLREVRPAALQPEGQHPGRPNRWLYPLKTPQCSGAVTSSPPGSTGRKSLKAASCCEG